MLNFRDYPWVCEIRILKKRKGEYFDNRSRLNGRGSTEYKVKTFDAAMQFESY